MYNKKNQPSPSPCLPLTLSPCHSSLSIRTTLTALSLLAALTLTACNARKDYPDAAPGWHSPDYSILFGRLNKIPGPTPDDPATFTLRFGEPTDAFNGEVALAPPERLVGYSGGEPVEVRGQPLNQPTNDKFNGRWYSITEIRMWTPHR